DGPVEIGFGGARGPGKTHALLMQIAADDCQRVAGLKALLLRRVGKAVRESFEDLRLRALMLLPHEYDRQKGILTFANGSRIILGHFKDEKDVDAYLGLEYDVIGVEEATTLTASKYQAIRTCNRTSKPTWRPRIYTSANPGGIGHGWYRQLFVEPYRRGEETVTRYIPATVADNRFINPEYRLQLERLTGWQRRAWLEGDWDIAAGQFFTSFRYEAHTYAPPCSPESIPEHQAVWCSLDYGFNHPTVCHLYTERDGIIYVVDELWVRKQLVESVAEQIRAMLERHSVRVDQLRAIYAGPDVFAQRGDSRGLTVADQYRSHGLVLQPARTDRLAGAATILRLLGDPDSRIAPSLQISRVCTRLIEQLSTLQHDPNRPEDVLKVNVDEDGAGGDDAYDSLRYGLSALAQTATDSLRSWSYQTY
ncbi:MAG: hypothetical protein IRY83_13230, partial [Chloroflexi bacterium]|nr:hypothetical protein [Chloroflexota bacterium]